MRIIAGELRGRRLVAPKGSGTRPTTDRIREALFQHLTVARIDGGFADRHVLDLFAGSGALGLEALSRGAESVTLVDEARSALAALRTNVDSLGVIDRAQVVKGRLPRWLERASAPTGGWGVVFADPPYARDGIDDVLVALRAHVATDAWVVYEHRADSVSDAVPHGWRIDGERIWGATGYTFVRALPDSE